MNDKEVKTVLKTLKNIKPLTCKDIGHRLVFIGFSGGKIHWKCKNCKKHFSEKDWPMSWNKLSELR